MGKARIMILDFQNKTINDLISVLESSANESDYYQDALLFLRKWIGENELFTIKTSGTTGSIKNIEFTKDSLIRSAEITLNTFSLVKGDTVLNSLPFSFVAGRMMLVRAIVGRLKLHLILPSANPIATLETKIKFAAFTPFQLQKIIEQNADKLQLIECVIVGGSKVEMRLEEELQDCKTRCYETFGMSETLTHVAIRKINGENRSPYFKVLNGFDISTTKDQCIIISAAHLQNSPIVTNDIVQLADDGQFLWLGRKDNVINTGGIKVYPETIEKKLAGQIDQAFMITKLQDEMLGERVVLVIETDSNISLSDFNFSTLTKYEKPKELRLVKELPRNKNGKIVRKIDT